MLACHGSELWVALNQATDFSSKTRRSYVAHSFLTLHIKLFSLQKVGVFSYNVAVELPTLEFLFPGKQSNG